MPADFTLANVHVDFEAKNVDKTQQALSDTMKRAYEAQQLNAKVAEQKKQQLVQQTQREKEADKQRKTATMEAAKEENKQAAQRKTQIQQAIGLAALATSGLPGSHAAASIAGAYASGGPVAGAAMAAAQGANYGIQGAGMASPASRERLDYQADRMQAGIGTKFIPALQGLANTLERMNDKMGNPQLNQPQFSNFADIRDRLQVEALKGSAGPEKKGISATGGAVGFVTGGMIGALLGSGALDTVGDAIDGAYKDSWLQKGVRGIKSVWE